MPAHFILYVYGTITLFRVVWHVEAGADVLCLENALRNTECWMRYGCMRCIELNFFKISFIRIWNSYATQAVRQWNMYHIFQKCPLHSCSPLPYWRGASALSISLSLFPSMYTGFIPFTEDTWQNAAFVWHLYFQFGGNSQSVGRRAWASIILHWWRAVAKTIVQNRRLLFILYARRALPSPLRSAARPGQNEKRFFPDKLFLYIKVNILSFDSLFIIAFRDAPRTQSYLLWERVRTSSMRYQQQRQHQCATRSVR